MRADAAAPFDELSNILGRLDNLEKGLADETAAREAADAKEERGARGCHLLLKSEDDENQFTGR